MTKGELAKIILQFLYISGLEPMGLSQQFETDYDNPFKVIYVKRRWFSSFVFLVSYTRFKLKEASSSFKNIRIYPEFLMEKIRTNMMPVTFQTLPSPLQIKKGRRTFLLLRSARL